MAKISDQNRSRGLRWVDRIRDEKLKLESRVWDRKRERMPLQMRLFVEGRQEREWEVNYGGEKES